MGDQVKTVLEIDRLFRDPTLIVMQLADLHQYETLVEELYEKKREYDRLPFNRKHSSGRKGLEGRVMRLEKERVYKQIQNLLDSLQVRNPNYGANALKVEP